jgi:hypothetical protein
LHGEGFESWHFHLAIPAVDIHSAMLIVDAPADDLPFLGYKTFFYNACTTGPDYIENFRQGTFVYTKRPCKIYDATAIFVRGIVEGDDMQTIIDAMNDAYETYLEPNIRPYGYHEF